MDAAESQDQGVEVVVALIRECADLLKKSGPPSAALSDEQVAYLIESGDFTAEALAETEARVARDDLAEAERQTRLRTVAASLSAAEVAQKLHIDASRVRHRQAKGSLYSFMAGGKRRYPTWQFTDDPTQSGLASITKSFQDSHPASIRGLMLRPQESLTVDGRRMTPPEWLLHGGDPQAVVDILDSFLQS
jgi:hypothetical protein